MSTPLPRRRFYTNPSAQTWTTPPLSPSTITTLTTFHHSLHSFAQTPLHSLPALALELGIRAVYLKDETSRLGLPSFKILGASWATYRALAKRTGSPPDASMADIAALAQGMGLTLFAATDGNHGRAVARMATLFGLTAKIYVPDDLDQVVRSLIVDEGASLMVVEGDYDVAVQVAAERAETEEGGVLVQDTMAYEGYEHVPEWVVEGYSTMLREVDEQLQNQPVDLIVAPVGVGSLAQAVVSHSKSSNRGHSTAVLTVEPDTAACLLTSLQAGEIISVTTPGTIMSGMNCGTVSASAWPILRNGVDASITVTDQEAHEAVKYLEEVGVKAGPCGGGALAGLRHMSRESLVALGIGRDSVIVVLCTEGSRTYEIPGGKIIKV